MHLNLGAFCILQKVASWLFYIIKPVVYEMTIDNKNVNIFEDIHHKKVWCYC